MPKPRGLADVEFTGPLDAARHFFTGFGALAAHPAAFALVPVYAVIWYYFSPQTFEWHSFATLTTLTIALLIQRSTHRDTQALHAKLDELLRTHPQARTELAHLDEAEPEEIEAYRKDVLRKEEGLRKEERLRKEEGL